MKASETSFVGLLRGDGVGAVKRIEIPLIQRDYAQGRPGDDVAAIRRSFLEVLHSALTTKRRTGLDFVYGEVDDGTFHPLDGQQRLTTLFLLHWYVASRAKSLGERDDWKRFSYATREGARRFCEHLVTVELPDHPKPGTTPRDWIQNQAWFMHVWGDDPTISSMLRMINAIDDQFAGADFPAVWTRLTDEEAPSIWFHRLLIEEMESADSLYIKMNSRGKPLTRFENFKARLEKAIDHPAYRSRFAHAVDVDWADVMWEVRGDDDIVDDEFMGYFSFVCELCEWRAGYTSDGHAETRAETLFGGTTDESAVNLGLLFVAFETWRDVKTPDYFGDLFTSAAQPGAPGATTPLRIFEAGKSVDLFEVCCHSYGTPAFGWSQRLLLYAVLVHRWHQTEDFSRRIRVVRNLIEASGNELRLERMPGLIKDVESVVRNGLDAEIKSFNQVQADNERVKAMLVERRPDVRPDLNRLEDHPILRGSLIAFDLDADRVDAQRLRRRTDAFHAVFGDLELMPDVSATLLCFGPYQRDRGDGRSFQLGSSRAAEKPWRDLFTGAAHSKLAGTRQALQQLLDAVAGTDDVAGVLRDIRRTWLAERDSDPAFDWRYYMVRYDAMREGGSGIFFAEGGTLGFSLCMLRTDKTRVTSHYRDPYLLAVYREINRPDRVEDPWFTGWEHTPRHLLLKTSETGIRVTDTGFEISAGDAFIDDVRAALSEFKNVSEGAGGGFRATVGHVVREGVILDTEDRVLVGIDLVSALATAGL